MGQSCCSNTTKEVADQNQKGAIKQQQSQSITLTPIDQEQYNGYVQVQGKPAAKNSFWGCSANGGSSNNWKVVQADDADDDLLNKTVKGSRAGDGDSNLDTIDHIANYFKNMRDLNIGWAVEVRQDGQ